MKVVDNINEIITYLSSLSNNPRCYSKSKANNIDSLINLKRSIDNLLALELKPISHYVPVISHYKEVVYESVVYYGKHGFIKSDEIESITRIALTEFRRIYQYLLQDVNENDDSDTLSGGLKNKKIFISYSHKDEIIAGKIKSLLEIHGLDVIIDSVDLMPAENIKSFITKSIRESKATISLVSKDSFKSA